MANMDFIVVPLGTYLGNHLRFGRRLRNCPKVFATNYFLKHDGAYTNAILDKKIWVLWAEGRVHGEYDVIKTPNGFLPKYKDLKELFRSVFGKDYTLADYHIQFSVRLDKYLDKVARMEEIFKGELDMPKEFWVILSQLRAELEVLKAETGMAALVPEYFL